MSDLLPYNATSQERALDDTTARISNIPVVIKQVFNHETCPVSVLPWMAWALSVTPWDSNWTEYQKRNVIGESINQHRKKGTAGSVISAANAFGCDVNIVEWFETSPTGVPYTFEAQISVPTVSFNQQSSIIEAILSNIPARCQGTVSIVTNAALDLNVNAFARLANYNRYEVTFN